MRRRVGTALALLVGFVAGAIAMLACSLWLALHTGGSAAVVCYDAGCWLDEGHQGRHWPGAA